MAREVTITVSLDGDETEAAARTPASTGWDVATELRAAIESVEATLETWTGNVEGMEQTSAQRFGPLLDEFERLSEEVGQEHLRLRLRRLVDRLEQEIEEDRTYWLAAASTPDRFVLDPVKVLLTDLRLGL